jgi:hypothetical protein
MFQIICISSFRILKILKMLIKILNFSTLMFLVAAFCYVFWQYVHYTQLCLVSNGVDILTETTGSSQDLQAVTKPNNRR